jgi:hypothetical protein
METPKLSVTPLKDFNAKIIVIISERLIDLMFQFIGCKVLRAVLHQDVQPIREIGIKPF